MYEILKSFPSQGWLSESSSQSEVWMRKEAEREEVDKQVDKVDQVDKEVDKVVARQEDQ